MYKKHGVEIKRKQLLKMLCQSPKANLKITKTLICGLAYI